MAKQKYVDWDGLVYYDGKIKDYIAHRDSQGLKMGGIIPFEKLPDPSFENLNFIYKVTDAFTSNEDFDKPNYEYKAGTWVQCANVGTVELPLYYYIIFNDNELEGGDTPVTPGDDIDLSNYFTKDETVELLKDATDDIDAELDQLKETASSLASAIDGNTEAIDGLVSELADTQEKVEELETALEAVQQTAGSNSVKLFAIESDLVDMSNTLDAIPETYATKDELEKAIGEIEHPTVDLTGYATEEWVNSQEFAKKSDISQTELFVVDYNAPNFAAALEAYNSGKLLLLTNAAPDPTGYAVMNYVREDMITFTKFLMSRKETHGAFNTYYLHNDNTWEVSKEVKLNKVDAVVDVNQDITGLTIGGNTYDLDHFATTETVNQITENIENNYVSNTTLEEKNYVTEQHIEQNYITIQDAADTYVTNEKVTEVVTNEVETVVTEQIETKVTEVIEQKIEGGEIIPNADGINYDTWDY